MYQEVSEVERRLSEIQGQVDRLTLLLQVWSEKQDRRQERNDINDSFLPIQDLRNFFEQERNTFRQMHEEPVKQLREQASNLTHISVAAASSAVSGYERTEARLAALEASFHQRLNDLSDQIQSMVVEVRTGTNREQPSGTADSRAWPLDDVVRLHSQLRVEQSTLGPVRTGPSSTPTSPESQESPRLLAAAPAELVGRMETLERDFVGERGRIKETAERGLQNSRLSRALVAALTVVALLGAILVGRLQQQLTGAEARVTEAEGLAAATARTAAEQIAAARQDVERDVAAANAAALKAETISGVLASPDLVRYNLVGEEGGAVLRAQTVFSRSRGLVFTGSRLPQLPAGSTYQIWLITPRGPYSAGLFTPDEAGRFTLASDQPPTAPAPIVGVSVTVEPAGGSSQPTGRTILARAPANANPA